MFNFDEQRFLDTQEGAINKKDSINQIIDAVLPDTDNIFFIGSGGVGILFDSTIEFARTRSNFPFHRILAAEFIAAPSKMFSRNSLVVIPSLSGTTKETLELVDFCRKQNVKTLALVGSPETPLEQKATYSVY
ncbi:MAG: SIS domain-containing protein, partial [Lactobacillus sp.]|nr:SIS domain-containing protein [Lactobacillus sp.]